MSSSSLPVRLRQARGTMSLAEASERSGVPEDRIRMYEEGERQPYAKTLRRLAQTYGVSARELSGGAGSERAAVAARTPVRPAPSRPRRRRRRVRSEDDADAHAAVELPIEVEQGQTIRVVIELIIRPKAPVQAAATSPAEGGAGPAPGGRAPEGPRPGPGFRQSGGVTGSAVAERRPTPRTEQAQAQAGPNGGPELIEPRDPLDEFRRAYSQFRRHKK